MGEYDEDLEIIGTVDGLIGHTDWSEPGHHTHLEATVERYNNRLDYYLVATEAYPSEDEDGLDDVSFARVDLDAAGWRELAALATKMAELIEGEQS